YYSAVEFTNETNVWDLANENLDQYATDAHFATEKTYDYYYEVHGRNSIDNAGHELTSFVHFNLVDYGYSNNVNAFWNGSVMTYGDGDDLRTPLTTVDICAHEITHGLTSYTANLVYQNESGALNEAFSDIFGTAVEFYATPSLANWTIGEDIYAPFRSLSNPKEFNLPDTYHGQNWNFGTDDYGGVHRNCGPLCYWFYLISEGSSGTNDNGDSYNVNGIGIDNAADIAFRLLTVYLTNYSNYADARFYGIQAAIDFFGACSYEVEQVTNAFYAIGVGAEYQASVIADFASDFTQNCSTPFTVKFQNSSLNGSSFVWDFGDGTTSTLVNPEHTYNSVGNFTVSLSADGGSCGENQIVKEDYISINPNYPCVTLMPTSGGATSTSCAGTLYDAGGPSLPYYNNTYATFTIKPPGASKIMLTINEFDIEPGSENYCDYDYIAFYDGEYINAPLINNTYYCNTTGNPVSIQSTGGAITIEFNSDPGLTLQGFEIQWICLQDDGIPYPNFSANRISTCDGRIQFENLTVNNVDNYLWDFGDGTTSTYANPYHLYNQSGVYT
ncbi:MAG: PKD domain-containing protein, partial [Bacteroidales bacterium]|nr:PKD domain-containing protein [Bacteroidales bacterium]